MLAYFAAVWAVLIFIPAFSLAARVPMTGRLWLYTAAGYFLGWWIGSSLVFVCLGGQPLAYGRWNMSRVREPKTWVGNLILLVIASGVGIFGANMSLQYVLEHP